MTQSREWEAMRKAVAVDAMRTKTGTSIASPHVAGLAGLLASQHRSARTIKKRITSIAVDLGANGRDIYYGSGRINAYAATKR
jgi:subtilisin family serine protease